MKNRSPNTKNISVFLWFIKWSALGIILSIVISLILLAGFANSYSKKHPSMYGVETQFAKLNYVSIARYLGLRIGLDDTDFLLLFLENLGRDIYTDGQKKIPYDSTESLSWDYVFYLYPYTGRTFNPKQVSNIEKRQSVAYRIVTRYPNLPLPIDNVAKRDAFTQIANSYSFAAFDYPGVGSLSWKKQSYLVEQGWKGHTLYAPFFPLDNQNNIGIYTLFSIRLLSLASGITGNMWEEVGLSCSHPLISTYKEIQENLTTLLDPMLSEMSFDSNTILPAITNIDYHHLVKYQPAAEQALKQRCNFSFRQ